MQYAEIGWIAGYQRWRTCRLSRWDVHEAWRRHPDEYLDSCLLLAFNYVVHRNTNWTS